MRVADKLIARVKLLFQDSVTIYIYVPPSPSVANPHLLAEAITALCSYYDKLSNI